MNISKTWERLGQWGVGGEKYGAGRELKDLEVDGWAGRSRVVKLNLLQLCGVVGFSWMKGCLPGLQSWCFAGILGRHWSLS